MNKIIYTIQAISQGETVEEEHSIECPNHIDDVDKADEFLEREMENIMAEKFYDIVLNFKVNLVGDDVMTKEEILKNNVEGKQKKHTVPDLYTKEYYEFLISEAWIIGCITPNDEILSVIASFEEAKMHGDYFPNLLTARRWRWTFQECLDRSVFGNTLMKDDWERVREYLQRKYDIRFWDNGHHDINYISKKAKGE